MSGTAEGGRKSAQINAQKTKIYLNGKVQTIKAGSFQQVIGREGGKWQNPKKGFGTHRELASIVGRKGGKISKRGSVKRVEVVEIRKPFWWRIFS